MKLEYAINNGVSEEINNQIYINNFDIFINKEEYNEIISYKNLATLIFNSVMLYHYDDFKHYEDTNEYFLKVLNKFKNINSLDDCKIFIGMVNILEDFRANIYKEENREYELNLTYYNVAEIISENIETSDIYDEGRRLYSNIVNHYENNNIKTDFGIFLNEVLQNEIYSTCEDNNYIITPDFEDLYNDFKENISKFLENNDYKEELVFRIGYLATMNHVVGKLNKDGLISNHQWHNSFLED